MSKGTVFEKRMHVKGTVLDKKNVCLKGLFTKK